MTSVRLSHPLKRYAIVEPSQRRKCKPLAARLANADQFPLADSVQAMIKFSKHVRDTLYWARQRTAEAGIIDTLSWEICMGEELRRLKNRRPDALTRHAILLGCFLHHWPISFKCPSTLLELVNQYSNHIQLMHLTRLVPVLEFYGDDDTPTERLETYRLNRDVSHLFIAAADGDGMSPKQLEIYISKAKRSTPAGRPRKKP